MSNNALKALSESGVSVWLDDISRERLRTGNLAKLMMHQGAIQQWGSAVADLDVEY